MHKIIGLVFIALIFGVGAPRPALAWDSVGHKIVAYIAWQQMSPATRENLIRILRAAPEDSQLSTFYMGYGAEPPATRQREFFELAATWPDIVRDRDFETRNRKYNKANWHYADTFWRQTAAGTDILTVNEDSGLAVDRLKAFDELIRSTTASDKEKAVAVAWMMHLTGDLHQPLHTSARVTDLEPKGDRGGNLVLLSPQDAPRGERLNLHGFWDSIVGRSVPLKTDACERTYIESVANRIMKKYPIAPRRSALELGAYDEWQKESFALNKSDVYTPLLKRFETPNAKYTRNAYRTAQAQLALAGYRLGETFNAALAGAPAPAPATAPSE